MEKFAKVVLPFIACTAFTVGMVAFSVVLSALAGPMLDPIDKVINAALGSYADTLWGTLLVAFAAGVLILDLNINIARKLGG